jgi:hypothetical protein
MKQYFDGHDQSDDSDRTVLSPLFQLRLFFAYAAGAHHGSDRASASGSESHRALLRMAGP